MNNQNGISTISFKHTTNFNVKNYEIPHDLSISQFLNLVKGRARNDFQVPTHASVEIVECGNYLGRAEDGPALLPSEFTFAEKYGDSISYLAFYIRVSLQSIIQECMLCNESGQTMHTSFGCQHEFCGSCANGCIEHGHTRCPICRHSL